jgi:hypothetical protein
MAERRGPEDGARPWLALAILLGLPAGLLAFYGLEALGLHLPRCLFKQLTGLPCATCGLSRMARALLGLDFAQAFRWHPVAAALLLASPLAALWDLRRSRRGEPMPAWTDGLGARLIVAGLFLGAWALQIARGI